MQVELAGKAYFPTILLSGGTAVASESLRELVRDSSRVWDLGADFAVTLLDNGARRRNVQRSQSIANQALASYRRAILSAIQDVERALNQQEVSRRQLAIQELQLATLIDHLVSHCCYTVIIESGLPQAN